MSIVDYMMTVDMNMILDEKQVRIERNLLENPLDFIITTLDGPTTSQLIFYCQKSAPSHLN